MGITLAAASQRAESERSHVVADTRDQRSASLLSGALQKRFWWQFHLHLDRWELQDGVFMQFGLELAFEPRGLGVIVSG